MGRQLRGHVHAGSDLASVQEVSVVGGIGQRLLGAQKLGFLLYVPWAARVGCCWKRLLPDTAQHKGACMFPISGCVCPNSEC